MEGNRAGKLSQPSQEQAPVTLGMERGMLASINGFSPHLLISLSLDEARPHLPGPHHLPHCRAVHHKYFP